MIIAISLTSITKHSYAFFSLGISTFKICKINSSGDVMYIMITIIKNIFVSALAGSVS